MIVNNPLSSRLRADLQSRRPADGADFETRSRSASRLAFDDEGESDIETNERKEGIASDRGNQQRSFPHAFPSSGPIHFRAFATAAAAAK